jgi:HEAT repeat protein
MNNPENRAQYINGPEMIKRWILDLASKKQTTREKARSFLAASGDSALDALIDSFSSPNSNIRWETGKIIESGEFDWSHIARKETLDALINSLDSDDGFVRLTARNSLVKIGSKAVSQLIEALSSDQFLKRWEAAKALSQIGDPSAIQALVDAMNDKVFDVRWVAAEGLIGIGNKSIEALLHLIKRNPESVRLREGVHHVLYALNKKNPDELLKLMVAVLEASEASLQIPFAAERALKSLKKSV